MMKNEWLGVVLIQFLIANDVGLTHTQHQNCAKTCYAQILRKEDWEKEFIVISPILIWY